MELKLNKMTTQELCEWFGIGKNTYSNKKQEYLKELEEYCDFEEVYGGVKISAIKIPCYISKKDRIRTIIAEEFDKHWNWDNKLDSLTNVKDKLISAHPELLEKYSEATIYMLLLEYRNKNYGKPFSGGGDLGICEYKYRPSFIDVNGFRIYRNFTEEEEKIRKELWEYCFNDSQAATEAVESLLELGVIEKEEAWDYYKKILAKGKPGWKTYMDMMQATGLSVSRATELIKSAF